MSLTASLVGSVALAGGAYAAWQYRQDPEAFSSASKNLYDEVSSGAQSCVAAARSGASSAWGWLRDRISGAAESQNDSAFGSASHRVWSPIPVVDNGTQVASAASVANEASEIAKEAASVAPSALVEPVVVVPARLPT